MKKDNIIKKRFDGYATEQGQFFHTPPTGMFGSGWYPKLHKAYLIVNLSEKNKNDEHSQDDKKLT